MQAYIVICFQKLNIYSTLEFCMHVYHNTILAMCILEACSTRNSYKESVYLEFSTKHTIIMQNTEGAVPCMHESRSSHYF